MCFRYSLLSLLSWCQARSLRHVPTIADAPIARYFADIQQSLPKGSPTTTLVSMERDILINLNGSVSGKSGLANLTTLRLLNMQVQSIQAEAFRSMKKLESLTITENNITDLQTGAFKGLGQLYILDLSNNELENLRPGVFEGLGGLRHLNLSSNSFYYISAGVFDGLRRKCNCQMIKTQSILDLSDTVIDGLYDGALGNLCFFTQLKISFIYGFQAKDSCHYAVFKCKTVIKTKTGLEFSKGYTM